MNCRTVRIVMRVDIGDAAGVLYCRECECR